MRDFNRKRWSPDGARPHVLLRAFPIFRRFAVEYTTYTEHDWAEGCPALIPWYPDWPEVVTLTNWTQWHITLAWLDTPAAELDDRLRLDLWSEMGTRLAQQEPVTVTARRVVATTHGIQIQIDRTAELDYLAATAADAMRTVYGAEAPIQTPGTDWQPHVMICRGIGDADTPAGPLPTGDPVDVALDRVCVATIDTFPPERFHAVWKDLMDVHLNGGRVPVEIEFDSSLDLIGEQLAFERMANLPPEYD